MASPSARDRSRSSHLPLSESTRLSSPPRRLRVFRHRPHNIVPPRNLLAARCAAPSVDIDGVRGSDTIRKIKARIEGETHVPWEKQHHKFEFVLDPGYVRIQLNIAMNNKSSWKQTPRKDNSKVGTFYFRLSEWDLSLCFRFVASTLENIAYRTIKTRLVSRWVLGILRLHSFALIYRLLTGFARFPGPEDFVQVCSRR